MILGDYAKGMDIGLIEILIIGYNINEEYSNEISSKIEFKTKKSLIIFEPYYNLKFIQQ
tara:strand:+ start:492 stop:668 length:177 start_codon:yes stop_codon:yes gene_type:complete